MKLTCNQCGHKWWSRLKEGIREEEIAVIPKACPACKRYDWQEPKKEGNKK